MLHGKSRRAFHKLVRLLNYSVSRTGTARFDSILPILALAVLALVPFYRVLLSPGVFALNDLVFPSNLDQLFRYFRLTSSTWYENRGEYPRITDPGGNVFLFLFSLPIVLLRIPQAWWMVVVTLVAGVSSYKLTFRASGSRAGGFVSGATYMYSFYLMGSFVSGFLSYAIAYSITPLAFLPLVTKRDNRSLANLFPTAIIIGLLSNLALSSTLLVATAVFLWLLLELLFTRNRSLPRKGLHVAKFALLVIVVVLTMDAVWLFPMVQAVLAAGTTSTAVSYNAAAEVVDRWSNMNPPSFVLIDSPPGELRGTLSSEILTIHILGSMAIIAIAMETIRSRSRFFASFGLLACVSLVFSNGANPPFGGLYRWLYLNVPIFIVLNRPTLFQSISALSVATLTGFSRQFLFKGKSKALGLWIILMLSLLVARAPPVISGNLDSRASPLIVPQAYTDADSWLKNFGSPGKVLLLPPYEGVRWRSLPGHASFPNPFVEYAQRPTEVLGGIVYNGLVPFVINAMYLNRTDNVSKVLGILGVRYVLVDLDQRDYVYAPYQNTSTLLAKLPRLDGMRQVWSEDHLHLFENSYALPLLFSANGLVAAQGDRRLLTTLSAIEGLNFQSSPVTFLSQSTRDEALSLLNVTRLVILQEGDWTGLAIATVPNALSLNLADYSRDVIYSYDRGWTTSQRVQNPEVWRYPYYLDVPFSDVGSWVLTTGSGASIDLPFEVGNGQNYDLWAYVFQGYVTYGNYPYLYQAPQIEFRVDDKPLAQFNHSSPVPGRFVWAKLGTAFLDHGSHTIDVKNIKGLAVVSRLVIVPNGSVDISLKALKQSIKDTGKQLLYTYGTPVFQTTDLQGLFGSVPPDYVIDPKASYGISYSPELANFRTSYFPDIGFDDRYTISVRASSSLNASISVWVDGSKQGQLMIRSSDYRYYSLSPRNLAAGTHNVTLTVENGERTTRVDQLFLSSSSETFNFPMTRYDPSPEISYDQATPAEYHIHGFGYGDSVLVFLESYHPFWELSDVQHHNSSFPAFSSYNGFRIASTGPAKLLFKPQTTSQIGLAFSIVSVPIVALAFVLSTRRRRKHENSLS